MAKDTFQQKQKGDVCMSGEEQLAAEAIICHVIEPLGCKWLGILDSVYFKPCTLIAMELIPFLPKTKQKTKNKKSCN